MKKIYRALFFLIGVAGVVLLAVEADITHTDWRALFDDRLPLVLLMQFVIWGLIFLTHTSVYRLILGPEVQDMSFLRLLKITVAGLALNSVTPAGLVGGEPYRIMELKRYCSVEKATSATLTFSIFYIVGHALLWLAGILLYFLFGLPGEAAASIVLGLLGAALAYACYSFIRHPDQGFLLSLCRLLARIPFVKKLLFRAEGGIPESVYRIDEGIQSFSREPVRFRRALLLEFAARLLESLEYFVILNYLREPITLPGALLVMGMASLIGNLFFIVPMQAGTREGGMLIALGWLGIDSSAGIRTSILYRARDLICILIGIVCILIEKKVGRSTPEP